MRRITGERDGAAGLRGRGDVLVLGARPRQGKVPSINTQMPSINRLTELILASRTSPASRCSRSASRRRASNSARRRSPRRLSSSTNKTRKVWKLTNINWHQGIWTTTPLSLKNWHMKIHMILTWFFWHSELSFLSKQALMSRKKKKSKKVPLPDLRRNEPFTFESSETQLEEVLMTGSLEKVRTVEISCQSLFFFNLLEVNFSIFNNRSLRANLQCTGDPCSEPKWVVSFLICPAHWDRPLHQGEVGPHLCFSCVRQDVEESIHFPISY